MTRQKISRVSQWGLPVAARASRAWFLVASALVAVATTSNCYSPDLDNCSVSCGADGACPTDQHCSNGYCANSGNECQAQQSLGGGGSGSGGGSSSGGHGEAGNAATGGAASGGAAPIDKSQGGGAGASPCEEGQCDPPSCEGLAPCGAESCCDSIGLPEGQFPMGRSLEGRDKFQDQYVHSDELPEHTAFVSAFRLDRFEVTTGRFRRFVEDYTGTPPTAGAGAHPKIAGSGWNASWNSKLPANREELEYQVTACPNEVGTVNNVEATYTIEPGANEEKPMVCMNWYLSFAFCVWDGGRLPTETEWEYAAVGGDENRLYPWSASFTDTDHASYFCLGDGIDGCDSDDLLNVTDLPLGRGRWGHAHMSGNIWEWTLDWDGDWYKSAAQSGECADKDCANLTNSNNWRMSRGGGFFHLYQFSRSAHRGGAGPDFNYWDLGVRCARDL